MFLNIHVHVHVQCAYTCIHAHVLAYVLSSPAVHSGEECETGPRVSGVGGEPAVLRRDGVPDGQPAAPAAPLSPVPRVRGVASVEGLHV